MSTALDLYEQDRTRTAAAYDAQRRQREARAAAYDAQRQQRLERAAAFDAANPSAVLHLRARRLAWNRRVAAQRDADAYAARMADGAHTRVVDEVALILSRLKEASL